MKELERKFLNHLRMMRKTCRRRRACLNEDGEKRVCPFDEFCDTMSTLTHTLPSNWSEGVLSDGE